MTQTNIQDSKFSFTIDGSWYLRSRVPVIAKTTDLSFETPELSNIAKNAIRAKMTTDLSAELRLLKDVVDDIVIAVDDSRSNLWRSQHKYLKPDWIEEETAEDAGYKGTRTYDNSINWLEVYKVYWEWLDDIKKVFGINNIKLNGAEADDVIALMSMYYVANGKNITWWGTDKDMIQLCHKGETAVAIYNMVKNGNKANGWSKTRQLTYTADAKKLFDTHCIKQQQQIKTSIFDTFTSPTIQPATNVLDAFNKYADTAVLEHPASFLFYKIVLGDDGDNVPFLFKYIKTYGKSWARPSVNIIYKVLFAMGLETDNDKIVDEMSIMRHMRYDDIYDDAIIKTFITNLYKEFCGKDITEEHEKWLIARFNENRKLVVLNGKEIPAEIISAFTYTMSFIDIHQQQLNKALLLDNHSALSAMQITTSAGGNVKDASNFINKMMNPGA